MVQCDEDRVEDTAMTDIEGRTTREEFGCMGSGVLVVSPESWAMVVREYGRSMTTASGKGSWGVGKMEEVGRYTRLCRLEQTAMGCREE